MTVVINMHKPSFIFICHVMVMKVSCQSYTVKCYRKCFCINWNWLILIFGHDEFAKQNQKQTNQLWVMCKKNSCTFILEFPA